MDMSRQTGREGAAASSASASASASGRSRTRPQPQQPQQPQAQAAASQPSRSTSRGASSERAASATGRPTHTAARAAAHAAHTATAAAAAAQPLRAAHTERPSAAAVRTQRSPLRTALPAHTAVDPSLDAFAARSAAVSAEERNTLLMAAWTHTNASSRAHSPHSSAMHSGRNSPREAAAAATDVTAASALAQHTAPVATEADAAAAASTSLPGPSLVPTGSARIVDLDPLEKGKIGSLLREVVTLQRSRAQLEQSKHEMEREMRSMAQRSAISEQEAAELRVQCQRGIDMLAEYQARMHAAEAAPHASATLQPSQQPTPPFPPHPLPPPAQPAFSDNPNISRLQELSERARAAASGVPSFYAATPAQPAAGSRSALNTPALNSASRLPHAQPASTVMRYVPSASAAATSPYQPHPEPATAAPIPHAPVVAALAQPHHAHQSRPPSPPPQPYVSAAQQQIDREYVAALVDAKEQLGALSHSLETQRKLDLSGERIAGGSRRHSRDPSPSNASRSVSPPAARAVAVVSAPAAVPSSVSILPAAVSGVTRTLALSSPESLEKRAIALANTMFERKMAEQAEADRRRKQLEEREQALRIPSAPAPVASAVAHPAAQPSAQPDRRAPTKPAGSSLSSFFHSHPLTSALSPLGKQRNQSFQPQQQSQRDEHKEESHPPQPQMPPSSSAATNDSESDFVSSQLSKSMRLAQSYAEERERRARAATAAAATTTTGSSRTFTRPSDTQLSAAPFDPAASASFAASSSIPRAAASSSSRMLSQDPSSPYSAILPSSQLALLTPTSRKIHRLISIQNPLHSQLQARVEAADREEREFAAKEASKLQEMAHKLEERRREVAKAEAMVLAKRERERAEAAAAITSPFGATRPPPPQPHAALSAVDRAKQQPASRARTPVETYVPPPFSFRPSSRASAAQQGSSTARESVAANVREASPVSEEEEEEEEYDRFNESRSTAFDTVRTPAAAAGGLFASRSTHTTPGTTLSTPSSVAQQHAAGHTSFLSPAPSSRPSTHARDHQRRAAAAPSDAAHAESDAEVWEVFHLRSPSNLQSKDAPTHTASAAAATSRSVSVATTPSLAQRAEANARNFGLSMLHASAQNQQRAALASGMEHYRAVADASTTFSPAAIHHALTTPAPPRDPLALSFAAPPAAAPPAAAPWRMPASSPSRMQVRLESLHMAQLERELDELVPHVLEELAMQRERAETPVEAPSRQATRERSDEETQRDRRIARMAREVELHSQSRTGSPAEMHSAARVHSRLAKQQQAMEEESKHNTQQAQRVLLQAQEARARSIGTSYSPAHVAGAALRARPNDFDASLLDVIDQMGDE